MVEEVKSYILTSSLGGNPWIDPDVDNVNGNLYRNFFPPSPSPDRALCVYQLPGNPDQRSLGNVLAWENPRLKISVRSPRGNYDQAKLDSAHIRDLLRAVTNRTVSGIFYMSIRPSGQPAAEALDPSSRPIFYTEYEVMKYPSE